MVQSKAATVDEYLEELSPEKRDVVSRVREVVLENLPEGYVESMNWGMISYEIPLATYPETYNGQPLSYMALAAQKRHYALYMMHVYQNPELDAKVRGAYKKIGKRLDMGKSCLRFRRLDDLPMEVIAELVASTPPEHMIAMYEASRKR